MTMIRPRHALILAALLFFIFAPFSIATHAQQSVDITGNLVNKTANGTISSSLTITLTSIDTNGNTADVASTTSDSQGQFSFKGVAVTSGDAYELVAMYKNVSYSQQISPFPPTGPVELDIYEPGASIDSLEFDNNTVIFGFANAEKRNVGVLESVSVVNNSDKAFVYDASQASNSMDILRFSLPSGYSSLNVQSNLGAGQAVPVDKGFGLLTAVPPGQHEVLYTYLVDYHGGSLTFTRTFPFGANTFTLLLPQNLATVKVDGLKSTGAQTIGSTSYTEWQGTNFAKNASLSISLSGLPQPTFFQTVKNTTWGSTTSKVVSLLILILILAIIATAIILVMRRSMPSRQLVTETTPSRESIIESIANLDESFEKGEVEKEEYERRRDILTSNLSEFEDKDTTDEENGSN